MQMVRCIRDSGWEAKAEILAKFASDTTNHSGNERSLP
jgi:hypothetical protein